MNDLLDLKNQTVIAVKRFNKEEIDKLTKLGYHHFGFNRTNDLDTFESIFENNEDIHFIGYLQSNKVKKYINKIDYLHSLSTLKLAKEIQKYRNTPLKTFIQLNLTAEETKNGIKANELTQFLLQIKKYDKINIVGLMTIGKENDSRVTNDAFSLLNQLKIEHNLLYTSMGMSSDYKLALANNASFIRLGTILKGVLSDVLSQAQKERKGSREGNN